MTDIKLHMGISQRVIFSLLRLIRFIQITIISNVLWRIFVYPYVYVIWLVFGDRKDNVRFLSFYKNKNPIRGIFGKGLKILLLVFGYMNGLVSKYNAYEFLLRWNPAVPLIALKHKKTTWVINWLGKETQEGWYNVEDGQFLYITEEDGQFMIIEKNISTKNPAKINIECVWTSGKHMGEKFTIKEFNFDEKDGYLPDIIYFPPRAIVWIFEIIISLGAATLLFEMVEHILKLLSESQIYKKILGSHLNELLTMFELTKNKLFLWVV